MNRTLLMALFFVLGTPACNEKPKADPTQAAPTPIFPAVPATTAAPAAVNANVDATALEQVPVQEDYEEKARIAITTENLDAEIGSLERELAE